MKKLLVIDDDSMVVKLIKDLTTAAGYSVASANNGQDGLELASHQKPDVILLDIMMPEMDGYKVAHQLKASPLTAGIPIIMLTAVCFDMNKQLALNMGVADYVTKPFDIKELLAKVERCVEAQTVKK